MVERDQAPMKRLIVFCVLWWFEIGFQMNLVASSLAEQKIVPEANQVSIGPTGISIPLGRILLVRKGIQYCAIRFTDAWMSKLGWERASYESYYQGDGSADFSKENCQHRKGQLYLSKGHWIGGGHYIHFWRNEDIPCGPIRLLWTYKTNVCFFSSSEDLGDFGIELAPTKWEDISRVNAFDARLRWYRYDEKRKNEFIPIEELWTD